MIAEKPYYRISSRETMLQGYLYKYVTICSVCPRCNKNISDIAEQHFFCICCGQEIKRDGKPRKVSAEFFEFDGSWLSNDIKLDLEWTQGGLTNEID